MPNDPLIGAVLDGRYRIDAPLGRGGMGMVYRARQLGVDRDVAVKLMRVDRVEHQQDIARFRREARTIARLRHPNTVRLIDHGTLGDDLYLVMELVDGQPLADFVAAGRLPPALAIDIIAQIADALTEAHAAGIIHRDLKPGNVVVGRVGDRPMARILDFGIAKVLDEETATITGATVGTPAYMAPEQVRAQPVGPAADIYALGVTAYEMLTGERPFNADSVYALLMLQVNTEPPDLHEKLPTAAPWPEVGALVLSMLAKDPVDRPASAAVVRDQLRAALRRLGPSAPLQAITTGPAFEDLEETASGLMRRPEPAPISQTTQGAWAIASAPDAPAHAVRPDRRWLRVGVLLAVLLGLGAWAALDRPEPVDAPRPGADHARSWPDPLEDQLAAHLDSAGLAHAPRFARVVGARMNKLLTRVDRARNLVNSATGLRPWVGERVTACLAKVEASAIARVEALLEQPPAALADQLPADSTPELDVARLERCTAPLLATNAGEDPLAVLQAQLEGRGGGCLQLTYVEEMDAALECLDAILSDAEATGQRLHIAAASLERLVRLEQTHLRKAPVSVVEAATREATALGLHALAFRAWMQLASSDNGTEAQLDAALAASRKLPESRARYNEITQARMLFEVRNGRYEAAVSSARAVWESAINVDADRPVTLWRQHMYALVLATADRVDDAIETSRGSIEGYRRVLGPTHPEQVYITRWLADLLIEVGRAEEAAPMLAEADDLLVRQPARQALARMIHARALLALGEVDAAASLVTRLDAAGVQPNGKRQRESFAGVRAWLAFETGGRGGLRAALEDIDWQHAGRACLAQQLLRGPRNPRSLLLRMTRFFPPDWSGRPPHPEDGCPSGAERCGSRPGVCVPAAR